MKSSHYRHRLTPHWPFVALVVIFASLMLALEAPLPGVSSFWLAVFRYLSGACWAIALKGRFARVGLPHSSWVLIPFMLLVLLTCILLPQRLSLSPLFGAGLFVLLHAPLAVLKDRPRKQALAQGEMPQP